ncbi:MAG TPA: carbamoyltransferase HypF [Candidatus Acidoferrum sp.]|jgi:hydrogenase maturation protein HypF|nr:carbamoyltransferase HypF [Candidatus Acidoferrum sp.]
MEDETVRLQLTISGMVQGVGFRPFVHALARRLDLAGYVANDSHGVTIEVEGDGRRVARFVVALERETPPLALIERVSTREVPRQGATPPFVIAPSQSGNSRAALVSPDVATCQDCLRELFDPADRRFRYAFANCTNCGPRFTITRDVPYDRATTTMAAFTMCEACAREYHDPADRRFHAQPLACPRCGPRLTLVDAGDHGGDDDPVRAAAALIRAGRILAVKGLGGYHLAADAGDERAVAALRGRKHREEKPFATMVADVDGAERLAILDPEERRLLTSARRPIVLVRRRPEAPVASATAPGNRSLGIMLPYTPLHHLLMQELGAPIVLTSGNVSDEPIAFRDADARERLAGIADAFLTHDRAIHIRTDDSVVRSFRGAPMPLRRARGYAPQPLRVDEAFPRPVLACGAELKNTICLGKGHHAFLSHHIGDLENYDVLRSFTEAVAHLRALFDVTPAVVAHDLHPEYLSTKWALEQEGVEPVGVQHHHAHVIACLADNRASGPVIGVAFDGLGYGGDGTLWGGEFLVADATGFERAGHLAAVPMPGGTAAIREPWRMAAVYLERAYAGEVPALPLRHRHEARWRAVLDVARSGFNSPLTSSAGRLFDAVSALLGVRDVATYEGQAAIELEQLVDPTEARAYVAPLRIDGETFEIPGADLVRAAAEDLLRDAPPPLIAARFHNGVAASIVAGCRVVRERSGLATVALSGGVFQNMVLLARTVDALEAHGFQVLRHRQVPPNDGGLSLGQAVIAAASPLLQQNAGRSIRRMS